MSNIYGKMRKSLARGGLLGFPLVASLRGATHNGRLCLQNTRGGASILAFPGRARERGEDIESTAKFLLTDGDK